jgi:nucleotide sugar dehydrogenase
MKKILIVGYGYVGKAMYNLFKDHYDVRVYDINAILDTDIQQITDLKHSKHDDLAIVCVPTPRSEDGSCDLTCVEDVMSQLETPLILLKSTIEVGTTDELMFKYNKRIVFSPEYCGESSYWTPYDFHTDIKETPFFIFGGDKEDTSEMIDYFVPVTGPTKRYIQCDANEAEMAKYMENSFYAMKIAFCYEMFEVCNAAGIDWNSTRELWLADPRINPMHTSVFHENEWPFSGKCLPKDISAITEFAKKSGYEPKLLEEVSKTNKRIHEIRKSRNDQDKNIESKEGS